MQKTTRLRICNLPAYATSEDLLGHIKKLWNDVNLTDCRVIKANEKSRRFGFVGFNDIQSAEQAQKMLNQSYIGVNQLKVELAYPKGDENIKKEWSQITRKKRLKEKEEDDNNRSEVESLNLAQETGRVRIINLPYQITSNELEQDFSQVGKIVDCNVVIDHNSNRKVIAYIMYMNHIDAVRCINEFNTKIYKGRVIKVEGANMLNDNVVIEKVMSETKKRLLQKKQEKALNVNSYNLLYVSAHSAATVLAEQLNTNASSILDLDNSKGIAAKAAIAESYTISETKKWLKELNIDENILEAVGSTLLGAKLRSSIKQSNTSLFIKHLVPSFDNYELKKLFDRFGKIKLFTVSPTRTIAFISYYDALHAKNAFKENLFLSFMGHPLYLEFAPAILDSVDEDSEVNIIKISDTDKQLGNSHSDEKINSTLYASNISFSTTAEKLQEHFSKFKGFINVKLLKSKKDNKSLGHGFIIFKTSEDALNALRSNLDLVIDGHHINLNYAKSTIDNASNEKLQETDDIELPATNTLLVKNLAFEVHARDLRELFTAYANVKSIRLPKRKDGRIRGFGFVELQSVLDAQKAIKRLQGVHLLGRRLIILPTDASLNHPDNIHLVNI